MKLCDENTIGVVAILGSTFDGSYEPVAGDLRRARRPPGARPASTSRSTSTARPARSSRRSSTPTSSGTSGCRAWPRSTPRATSTGSSTPASAGSSGATPDALPEDLIFWVNYLGDNMPTFALNFSRPGAQVVAQYYNFLRLGFDGYRRVQALRARGRDAPRGEIAELGPFELLTRGRRAAGVRVQAEATTSTTSPSSTSRTRCASAAGRCPPTRSRRTGPTSRRCASSSGAGSRHDLADLLIDDLQRQLPRLQSQPAPVHDASTGTAFAH